MRRTPFDPARDIGMVFQQALLLKWRTILDNVLLPAEIVGLPIKAARARARDLLNLVGLAGYEDKYPQQLSGGMQQRTAIARAFIHDPKLILMDEPFGALDALTREQMNLEMLRIWRESGKTIIFVTHSIQEAVFLGSHCAVLTAGPARMAEYFPIELPFPRALPIKTTDAFGAYARRIYASLGLGAGASHEASLRSRIMPGACSPGIHSFLMQSQQRKPAMIPACAGITSGKASRSGLG